MAIKINSVKNHRERENGVLIYPVFSRRSKGLSIGINLFPDKKSCAFNCPYCEVFPFSPNEEFSVSRMEDDLRAAVKGALEKNIEIKDICFSGNGEPTLSPFFSGALKSAESIRTELASLSRLIIITNGTGLLHERIYSLLTETAANPSVNIWLKIDAGTSEWYHKMNRSLISHEKLKEKIKQFIFCSPVTVQTMLCAINGKPPSNEENIAWENFILELAENNESCDEGEDRARGIRKVQIYGKARPAPEDPLASELPQKYLEDRARSLQSVFAEKKISTPVEIYI
ncbi:MAG: hypothetical protein FWC21_04450 [Treponema sp.]|nr:hypothetical protein [Treponema sp.]